MMTNNASRPSLILFNVQGELGFAQDRRMYHAFEAENTRQISRTPEIHDQSPPFWQARSYLHQTRQDNVLPRGQFVNGARHHGIRWGQHCDDIRQLLAQLYGGRWASTSSLNAYDAIVTRGLDRLAAILPGAIVVNGFREVNTWMVGSAQTSRRLLPGGYEYCEGSFGRMLQDRQRLSSAILHRRLWASHINFRHKEQGTWQDAH